MIARNARFALLIFVLSGCNRDPSISLKDQRIKLVADKKWQLKKYEQDFPENNPYGRPPHYEELYPFKDSARNDDFETYHSDSTYEWNDNVILSTDNYLRRITGKWHITNDGNRLFVQWDGFPEGGERIISTLNDSLLILVSETREVSETDTYTYELRR